MTIDREVIKLRICDLIFACYAENFEEMYKAKSDVFLWIDNLITDRDAKDRELDFVRGQLEHSDNELYETQLRLENLKTYGSEVPDIRDMYPTKIFKMDGEVDNDE